MATFLEEVLLDLQKKTVPLSQLTLIVPSKRASVFIKYYLSKIVKETLFVPQILSIEEFVQELSELKPLSNTELLFRFYASYKKLTPLDQLENFDSFSKWAQILLQDFNEIDRYLIEENSVFDYISSIQELNHWALQTEQTDFVKNYLTFWKRLKTYYKTFVKDLTEAKYGYQGLIYRQAVENIEAYLEANSSKTHVFIGFNALNTAEEHLIQSLLQNDMASVYWDIDERFFNDELHDAGLFARQHKKNWKYFRTNPFNWISNNYTSQKVITAIGAPKFVGQAKLVGHILEELAAQNVPLNNIAVVLGHEGLIEPLLNSIPEKIDKLNITMGFPLRSLPISALFENLFAIHKRRTTDFYYKDILTILSHNEIQLLSSLSKKDFTSTLTEYINTNNLLFLNTEKIKELTIEQDELVELLFGNWNNNPQQAILACKRLIMLIKNRLDKGNSNQLYEPLYRFNKLFNELERLNLNYQYFDNISSLHTVFKELLESETMDFKGEPLDGIQIMGMLESRVLDFETVIITSVNEGVLPSGKSNNSFIPFDVKRENKLPTFKEKDAVYTYHFYRLLQRAKNVYIIYNTELDPLNGGEKSRFLTQLEIENIHKIDKQIAAPQVSSAIKTLKEVTKTIAIIDTLKEVANSGFSPSSLSTYIRNPIDFYYQKVLGIYEVEEVEETVAFNTLGSVIHNTLEDFYKPFKGHFLSVQGLKSLLPTIDKTVSHHFKSIYKQGDLSKGKNLIIYEIAKRYIENFLHQEIRTLQDNNTIKIVDIEKEFKIEIDGANLGFPFLLKGKIDRIDEFNGITRVIDYKTGSVEQNKVLVSDWDALITDYDMCSKSFQLLCYCYALQQSDAIKLPVEAGIISFKKLSSGLIKFMVKDSENGNTKSAIIDNDILVLFEEQLKILIKEIMNPDITFLEKELDNERY